MNKLQFMSEDEVPELNMRPDMGEGPHRRIDEQPIGQLRSSKFCYT